MSMSTSVKVGGALFLITIVVCCTFILTALSGGKERGVINRFELNLEPRKYYCREVKALGYNDRYDIYCDRIK